ncbi:hypothetical protein K3N28_12505 [Glycomyces sp. TRM65418]|uniref:hypothetical protein n=1 Tax=Glycomyces sp. TRM65418 TaxID=2867006 RepID=UPI001CE6BF52|nr:hypothetical protein [Glycomyces sp. TRM65418]MCC3763885.1 hypothetical protein [Glycomyces sp. TRM65418]QZD53588.1 hypothetical protein K3N28_12435 [Glycomyces sp. TRM65418]
MTNLAEQYGSDISQYPEADSPGAAQRVLEGTPVVGGVARAVYGAIEADDAAGAITAVAGEVQGLAMEALFALRDPIYALAEAGLTIVLELVEPFNDVLEMVSGDPQEMARQGEVWGQVAAALEALSGETGQTVASKLTGWQGKDADAAYEQLYAVEAAIMATSHEALTIQTLLGWAQAAAEAVYGCIKSILAELVAWLITRGLIALANSAWSFGASVATFLLSAVAKSFAMFTRVMDRFKKVVKIFGGLSDFMIERLKRNPFRGINPLNGFELAGKDLWKRVLVTAAIKGGTGLLQGAGTAIATGAGAAQNAVSGAMYSSSGGGGPVTVDLDSLEGAAGSLEGHAGNAGSIRCVAEEASATEMAWGLPGAVYFEQAYTEGCDEMVAAITGVEDALNGDAIKLRDCAVDYRAADDEAAAALNGLLAEFEN